ncbi:DUF2891 family protein [Corynebacterium sp. NPDC060344]|uniref:DUF2891 family protein n=1 Tax=Corynebacterium sp. NPDC060344 TaxID=3347101 RepID=UPI0036696A08
MARSTATPVTAGERAQLARLAAAPAQCISEPSRKHPASPLFGNCWDWHSDVHAHWALYAVSGHTGDPRWAQAAHDDLPPDRLQREANYLGGNAISGNLYENPFGLAWLLRLARERESVTGDAQLRQLADVAVPAMKKRMDGWSDLTWQRNIRDSEYQNASWALLNMWEWAQFTGDSDLAEWVRTRTDRHLKKPALDETLPTSFDAASSDRSGYFAPALFRLAAVMAIDGDASKEWASERIPSGLHFPAYPNAGNAHSNALNFSRAFALKLLSAQLGREDLSANATELIEWQMARPTVWEWGHDYANTHWIAQMGVLAITGAAGPGSRVAMTTGPEDPDAPSDPDIPIGPGLPGEPDEPGQPGLPGVPVPPSLS